MCWIFVHQYKSHCFEKCLSVKMPAQQNLSDKCLLTKNVCGTNAYWPKWLWYKCLSDKCLWDKCLSDKCLWDKCLSDKWYSDECQSSKWPLIKMLARKSDKNACAPKCLSDKCVLDKYLLEKKPFDRKTWSEFSFSVLQCRKNLLTPPPTYPPTFWGGLRLERRSWEWPGEGKKEVCATIFWS